MIQLMVPFMVFFAVLALGGAVLLIRGWRRRMLEARLYGQGSVAFGDSAGGAQAVTQWVSTVDQIGRAVSSGKPPEPKLREWLAQAGYYDDAAPTVYIGAQLVLALLGLTLGGAAAFSIHTSILLRAAIFIMLVAAFALIPTVMVTLHRRKRTSEVRRTLPDAIDLLEICVSSGMGLDMA